MRPLVTMIIVNYNGYSDTVECLKSIKKIQYPNYNIVVLDNCSSQKYSEDQINYIKENAVFLKSDKNLGFAGGNNVAIQYAKEKFNPKYYLLINNDTVVKEDFLDKLVDTAEQYPEVGLVCGKIYWYDAPNCIWFAGGTFDQKTGGVGHSRYNDIDHDFADYVKTVTFATGCLWLLPSAIIDKVGLLDEDLFLYAEDSEYSCRIMNAGYKLYYCNSAIIYHKVSRSSASDSDISQYYNVRNNLYLIKKYATSKPYAYLVYFYRRLKDIVKKRLRLVPVLCGVWDFTRGIKGKWSKQP